eukprot:maker-scaffold193_size270907-snap-gene-0.15 protein:Tk01088 transcript:maker-scaffold193_size270907-snap-gene-0.15-mRNA-1 annotation:"hypothetical protein DAPPUDRAFT_306990"
MFTLSQPWGLIAEPEDFSLDGDLNPTTKMIPRPSSVHVENEPSVYSQPVYLKSGRNPCLKCLDAMKNGIISGMERFFFFYGKAVANRPGWFIFLCILIVSASGSGLMKFYSENVGHKLWISEASSSRKNVDWLWENYPPSFRFASLIFEAEDILVPEVIQSMYSIHKEIEAIKTVHGEGWRDNCQMVPVFKAPDISQILSFGRRKRDTQNITEPADGFETSFQDDFFSEDDGFGNVGLDDIPANTTDETNGMLDMAEAFSADSYPQPYCDIVEGIETACFEMSILELWANDGSYDDQTDSDIASLTKRSIIDKLNQVNTSGVFLIQRNFSSFLSEITYDPTNGQIIAARATVMRWFGRMNGTEALHNSVKERNEPITHGTLEFEGEMLKIMLNETGYPDGLKTYANARRSFGDVAGSTILGDVGKLGIGYTIVFFFVMIMLGRFNCVEQRAFLSFAGIMGVGMGIITAYGVCSALGLFFGPMHGILPFLLLGIGIDDMFVIVQCFNTLTEEEKSLPLIDKFGATMQHAGVAITITSITDVIAFGIGGSTVIPALKSFCLYASVGIIATYFYQCTFFVAWMAIDQRRIEAKRDGCCPCWTHSNWTPNALSQKDYLGSVFTAIGHGLTKGPIKILVIILTLAITGVAIWGNVLLEQEFDITWFLPPDTYIAKWFVKNKEYFPFGGDRVIIYCHNVDYIHDYESIANLVDQIKQQTDIVDDVESWTDPFTNYMNKYFDPDFPVLPYNQSYFNSKLSQFFFSPRGGKYREQFEFKKPLQCGQEASQLMLSKINFVHKVFSGPKEHIPAMNRIKELIAQVNASGRIFPMSQGYTLWETDEIISEELYRNLGLAVLCVFITTLFLISNVITSFLVLVCVILSLIDVGGFMHFWNLTIDTVSANNLIIAIGLCVDYSAHIAHRFMVEHGTRNQRVRQTLRNIGPAVLNGGFSTFLAFILLADSKSHVFSSFFKIFFLVVTFGLFHGLVFLPVILSILGPGPNAVEIELDEHGINVIENGRVIATELVETSVNVNSGQNGNPQDRAKSYQL